MNYVRKVLSALGGIFLAALLIAALVPKATRGVAAALVQIVPGSTTHLGQHESQSVSLACVHGSSSCVSIDPTGAQASTPYVVPLGYTLIVTDYEWQTQANHGQPGTFSQDSLFVASTFNFFNNSIALADAQGVVAAHEHYEAGIRVGSGVTIGDFLASISQGDGLVQGYLVPN